VKIYWSEILCCVARPWYNKNLFQKGVIPGNCCNHYTWDLLTSGILCSNTVIIGNVFGVISLAYLKFMIQKWNNQPYARSIKLFLGVLVAVGKMKSESLTVVKKKRITIFDLNFCSQNILKPNFICNEGGGRHAGRVCKP
jgi:hypothetical protein